MKKNNEKTLKEWEELLDKMGLSDTSTTKMNIAQMMESEASKLLKKEMKKNNIISDWIDKYGDPEIEKKVKNELETINKERYNQIINEVYKNYRNAFVEGHVHEELDECLSLEEFIEEIKTDSEFSENWGLKIEERELRDVDRQILLEQKGNVYRGVLANRAKNYKSHKKIIESIKETCDEFDIPTKLITLEYNQEKIYIYE